jgi:hypothetical protein
MLKTILSTTAAILLTVVFSYASRAQDAYPGFDSLFDGKTLTGWSGDERFWSVEKGAIVGQTSKDNPTKKNTFLVYEGKEFGDFDLRFSFKVEGGNSGIQYRSELIGPHFVKGLQADFEDEIHDGKDKYSGMFFEENGRMFMGQRGDVVIVRTGKQNPAKKPDVEKIATVGEADELGNVIRHGAWNSYQIIARSNVFIHIINGNVMSIGIDEDQENFKASGILAWQLHAGPPLKIEMKDIRIREL